MLHSMKRLNPNTNLPFKFGDVREDGYIFLSYSPCKIKKNGNFEESWLSPISMEKRIEGEKQNRIKNKTRTKERYRDRHTSALGRSKSLIKAAKQRVMKTGGKVTISVNWVEEQIVKGECALTGVKFDLNPSTKTWKNPYSPSLDRIDSSDKNYSFENTRVICTWANLALNEFGEEIFKEMIESYLKKSNKHPI